MTTVTRTVLLGVGVLALAVVAVAAVVIGHAAEGWSALALMLAGLGLLLAMLAVYNRRMR